MAAVLKKRVAAKFSQVIQEEGTPVVKKLRLIYLPRTNEQLFDLNAAVTSRDALQVLLEVERSLPLDGETLEIALTCLFDRMSKENESVVRAKIVHLIGLLCKSPSISAHCLVEDIANILKTEKSHVVIGQLISALLNIGRVSYSNSKLSKHILDIAFRFLNDTSHMVRCKCLELIGVLGSAERETVVDDHSPSAMSVLCVFSNDSDGRVRAQAFESMLMLHQRGIKLAQILYGQVCNALTDDHEGVRLTALKLVWVLVLQYPEHMVKLPNSDERLRLVDDGFSRICNMVNDVSMKVRAEAASLLGSLHNISPRFLEQTLDKKLMSNMRRKHSAHERQKEYFESGEWATGQKWADDAPREDMDPNSISLISSGACGAFVHGLEDEYMEVRNAALDSLCELASRSSTFARQCQDFLVDMFNDEIETVRLNAINSLRKICHHFMLREDQLEIILSVLKDFNFEIREALREMLCCCQVSTKECFSLLILTLLENLKRYPEDRLSVWKCMMNLGKQHQSLVLALAPDLISSHPYLESLEPDVNDPAYIGILISVFNSAVDNPTMLPLFPAHLSSHYLYLRNWLPDLVPRFQLSDADYGDVTHVEQISDCESFLSQTLQRLDDLPTMDQEKAVQLIETGIRDLHHVEQVEPHLAASAQCVELYLQCQLILHRTFASTRELCALFTYHCESDEHVTVINKVQDLLLQMENQYLGIGDVERAQIYQLHLRVTALKTLVVLQSDSSAFAGDKQLACSKLLQCLKRFNRPPITAEFQPDQFTSALLLALPTLKSYDLTAFQSVLISLASRSAFAVLKLKNQLQRVNVRILEPLANSELTVKFTAGLATSVGFIAVIDNVCHIDRLRIQVKYPDQQIHLVVPSVSDFKQLSSLVHKLVTKVLLSHVLWSESCKVLLSVVLLCPGDSHADSSLIQLCSPVPVVVSPTPPKR